MQVNYFAAARAARGLASEELEIDALGVATVGDLARVLGQEHSGPTDAGMTLAEVFRRCTFLADGQAARPDTPLEKISRVDVLPPFAGG